MWNDAVTSSSPVTPFYLTDLHPLPLLSLFLPLPHSLFPLTYPPIYLSVSPSPLTTPSPILLSSSHRPPSASLNGGRHSRQVVLRKKIQLLVLFLKIWRHLDERRQTLDKKGGRLRNNPSYPSGGGRGVKGQEQGWGWRGDKGGHGNRMVNL